ncbi:MAG: hypothetical protein ACXQT3_06155, partial [Methermicoccaceae archaeon]
DLSLQPNETDRRCAMAYYCKALEFSLPFLRKLGEVYFDTLSLPSGKHLLDFQAHTLKEVKRIKSAFPPRVWKRTWNSSCNWWEYTAQVPVGEEEELRIRIYAVEETPAVCKPIVEKKVVKRTVPTAYKEEVVEKEVIVGWECKGGEEA